MKTLVKFVLWLPVFSVFINVTLQSEKTLIAEVKGDIKLECQFEAPVDECYWLKDNVLYEVENRYEYTGDFNAGDCSIEIKGVKLEDGGQWVCGFLKTSYEKRKKESKSMQLSVVEPPTVTFYYKGLAMENGQKLYFDAEQNFQNLACLAKTQLEIDQFNLSWSYKATNDIGAGAIIGTTNTKLPGYVISRIDKSKVKSFKNIKKIFCELKVGNSGHHYKNYIKITQ